MVQPAKIQHKHHSQGGFLSILIDYLGWQTTNQIGGRGKKSLYQNSERENLSPRSNWSNCSFEEWTIRRRPCGMPMRQVLWYCCPEKYVRLGASYYSKDNQANHILVFLSTIRMLNYKSNWNWESREEITRTKLGKRKLVSEIWLVKLFIQRKMIDQSGMPMRQNPVLLSRKIHAPWRFLLFKRLIRRKRSETCQHHEFYTAVQNKSCTFEDSYYSKDE